MLKNNFINKGNNASITYDYYYNWYILYFKTDNMNLPNGSFYTFFTVFNIVTDPWSGEGKV